MMMKKNNNKNKSNSSSNKNNTNNNKNNNNINNNSNRVGNVTGVEMVIIMIMNGDRITAMIKRANRGYSNSRKFGSHTIIKFS
ncbi:hypothetical protein M0813_07494 [Anaeramoeba flamelloides]|uniref:Uncharacterized protein n=1 Tax=Anaeramoeba flamelloides TaxID=1746091 RepID=A0ABQ8XF25_9EUKA|nr:hypothetical protein M0813_07494 [Anaeramoeba flamelloides]